MTKNIVVNAYRNQHADPGLIQAFVYRSQTWAKTFDATVVQMIQERVAMITPVTAVDPPMNPKGQPEGSEHYAFKDTKTGENWSESSEEEAKKKRDAHIQKETDRFHKNHVDPYRPPVDKWLQNASDWATVLQPAS